jgi:acetyl-CoA carboxylase biotin carboxylase subunit
MFKKILIANRGEIACRVIRTCKKLGISSVGIYSEADAEAMHVQMADESYLIGRAPPSESYLNIVKIIEIALFAQVDAIHPGYGFLSENAAFAVACRENSIKFIGPTPEVLEKLKDKVVARQIAKKAGVPVLPGTNTAVGDKSALKRAMKVGFPLMVKAAAGGGGIGMEIVKSPQELANTIQRARSQAASSFGSTRLYFERYLEHASHIEVQILADEKNNTVHFFERDCSVQRRNQKIIEVAPTVKIKSKQRKTLIKNALKLAKHVGYTNLGTVEFLVSTEGDIYFLELNKRIQVEHGITEMITGFDLVELQIWIATGERLPFKQKAIHQRGFAIEVRINAEDPETFLPSPGIISSAHQPKENHKVRIDGSIVQGNEVSPFYDSLLAKLMCWGDTREEARLELLKALGKFTVKGIETNIPFLKRVLVSSEFVEGIYDTGLVQNIIAGPSESSSYHSDKREKEIAAATAVAVLTAQNGNQSRYHEFSALNPWKILARSQQLSDRVGLRRGWR